MELLNRITDLVTVILVTYIDDDFCLMLGTPQMINRTTVFEPKENGDAFIYKIQQD